MRQFDPTEHTAAASSRLEPNDAQHIASCVARVMPARFVEVLNALEPHSVFQHNETSLIVLVLEGANTGELLDQMDRIRQIAGVLSVELVYQHAEDAAILSEPVACQ